MRVLERVVVLEADLASVRGLVLELPPWEEPTLEALPMEFPVWAPTWEAPVLEVLVLEARVSELA